MHTGRAFAGLQRPLLAHPVWRLIPDRTCNHPHPLVIPAQAGILNPRLLFQHAPSAAARPVPHYTPHWVPACAGTTGWTAGASSPLPCRHDGLVRWCPHQRGPPHRRPPQAPPPRHSGEGRNPGPTPTVATRSEQCCTSGASSHAALGTGLRRYDGLDGWCLFAVALPV